MEQRSNERRILHVVSDFRSREWDNPRELRALLSDVERLGTDIHFVWSARGQQPNLAITGLQPAPETRASGVPLFMTVQVTNYGAEPQEKIPLRMRTFAYDAAAIQSGGAARPIAADDDLPLMQIDRINPYETVTQRVQVYFAEAGKHVVQAMLPEDAVPADNLRWCVVDFPEAETVLVIDGDPKQRNAFYMQAIFEPGQRRERAFGPRSAIRPTSATSRRTRCGNTAPSTCATWNGSMIERWRTSSRTCAAAVDWPSSWVLRSTPGTTASGLPRNAAGLFPVPLDHDDLLDDDPVNDTPDLEVLALDHPLFRELVQGQNPIIRMIRVERFLPRRTGLESGTGQRRPRPGAAPQPGAAGGGKDLGEGRVIAFLTTYAPTGTISPWGPMPARPPLASPTWASATDHDRVLRRRPDERFLQKDKYQHNVRVFLPGPTPPPPSSSTDPPKNRPPTRAISSLPCGETKRPQRRVRNVAQSSRRIDRSGPVRRQRRRPRRRLGSNATRSTAPRTRSRFRPAALRGSL